MTQPRVAGRVSIVVLNWNSGELGAAAAVSAQAQNWSDIEVIVVDNASSDGSLEAIVAAVPDVTVVQNGENLGFGAGMNAGFAVATGAYFLPLNCDAELDPDYVPVAVAALEDDSRRAAFGGRVHSPRVGSSGPLRITAMMRTASLPDTDAGPCDKVNGACPVFLTSALDEVVALGWGPYDGTYFVYGEDVDLARTLHALGWMYHFDPAARASHVRSFASSPRLGDRRGRLRTTTLHNRHRNIMRHGRSPWWLSSGLALVQDMGFVVLRLLRRDWAIVPDTTRAWAAAAATVGPDRRRRRQLRGVTP